jgi:hypothetical protein
LAFNDFPLGIVVSGCSWVFITPLQRKKIGSVSGKMKNLLLFEDRGSAYPKATVRQTKSSARELR